jgi:hypothetical protein
MIMTDIWMPRLLLGSQVVVLCVLGALVAVGKDTYITDALLAVSGSLVGTALVSKAMKAAKPTE